MNLIHRWVILISICFLPVAVSAQGFDTAKIDVHSEWTNEEAFDAHSKLPHMGLFFGVAGELITHSLQAVRTKQIG